MSNLESWWDGDRNKFYFCLKDLQPTEFLTEKRLEEPGFERRVFRLSTRPKPETGKSKVCIEPQQICCEENFPSEAEM